MKRSEVAPAPGLAEAVLFQRDLYLYWRLARSVGGLPLTTHEQISRPLLRRLRAELAPAAASLPDDASEWDEVRLFFLRRLLERLGLLRRVLDESVEPTRAKLVATEERELARYLAHPLAERLRICARLWMAGGWWPDLPGAGDAPAPLSPAAPRIAIARRQLIETLLALAPGDPISAPPGPRPHARSHPLRARQRRGATSSRSSHANATSMPHLAPEDQTQRAALLGPLTWMGYVIADRDDPVEEIRLAGLPLAALRRQPTPATLAMSPDEDDEAALVERHGRIVAQADLTLIAYPPLTAPALYTLDSCAERDALDQTARYHLTRNALAAARARRQWQAANVAAQLEALTATALPANVRVTLNDWERHVERLRLTPEAPLLTVEDTALLDALLADRTTAAWVERRLAPTVALLTPDALPHARRWLFKRGHLPATIRHDTPSDRRT